MPVPPTLFAHNALPIGENLATNVSLRPALERSVLPMNIEFWNEPATAMLPPLSTSTPYATSSPLPPKERVQS